MKKEINIMIELQHYWDIVMQKESETERHKKSIQIWEKKLSDLKKTISSNENLLKDLKLKLKQSELDLEELNSRITRIQQRKDNIKSERELEAQNNELKKFTDERDSLENTVLELMEKIESDEAELNNLNKELEETSEQTTSDIKSINEKITLCEKHVDDNRNQFNSLLEELSPSSKTKFAKLIKSKDGIAIAKLNGEICSHCNFQVPSSIAVEAEKRQSLKTCTNCGRFIY